MLYAYCDESYGSDLKTTPVYVVAGFVATERRWKYFESLWQETMKELGIEQIGSHAAKCANGSDDYTGMTRAQRDEIQHRLMVDICAAELFGVVTVLDMVAYREHEADLLSLFQKKDHRYLRPHAQAMAFCIRQMLGKTAPATSEPITFVADRGAGSGTVKSSFETARKNPDLPWRGRLGTFNDASRKETVGLQAADLLAWIAFRYATDTPNWQWKAFRPAIGADVKKITATHWSKLIQRLRDGLKVADDTNV
jgi:Protein of unknown function (DUF3800)